MSQKSPITTHVLDTSTGAPAVGLEVALFQKTIGNEEVMISAKTCNHDGRVGDLITDSHVWAPGVYRLRFATGKYFSAKGKKTFYPHSDVTFEVDDTSSHYHVPLLLSPFGYSTYRGS